MANNAAPNVWSQMNYVPPRGRCNFRASLLSPQCNCLRFMLHPLKSSSSYECDGCAHHASFHSMENRQEDEIRKRWEVEAKEKQDQENREMARPRKRLRELGYRDAAGAIENGILTPEELNPTFESVSAAGPSKTKAKAKRGGKAVTTRAAAVRARGRIMEISDDETEEVLDVD